METKNTIKETVYLKSIKNIMDFVEDMSKIRYSNILIVNGDNEINAKSIVSVLNCVKFGSPTYVEFTTEDESVCGAFLERISKYKDSCLSIQDL